ncbi:MAG: 50S ribosomal protein L11 methyltransferase [Bernardetiaceae bacterium]
MDYILLSFHLGDHLQEILMAELSLMGYGAFCESQTGFETAIEATQFDSQALDELLARYADQGKISYTYQKQAKQNWNAIWEASFDPILVEGRCRVRAHFHDPDPAVAHDLIITPKMSFGTGHHQTTRLMLAQQLHLGNRFTRVLDLGTGTGVLGILAYRLGAQRVWGFDIDPWSVENAQENARLNNADLHVSLGTVADAQQLLSPDLEGFDLILANINRHVLEQEIPLYVDLLLPKGILLLSGFYEGDIPLLLEKTPDTMTALGHTTEDDWACLRLEKQA